MRTPGITLERQIRCAQRELRLRRQVYPQLVQDQRLPQKTADQEIACMAAIVETLKALAEGRQLDLFARAGS
jgi:hypothetical protein